MRKCCTDPNGKKTSFGKRSWKMWWCVVQDLAMYLYKDEQCGVRSAQHHAPQLGTHAIRLHHALATRAHDYNKKQHVFRLYTADRAQYLLQTRYCPPDHVLLVSSRQGTVYQTSDSKELQGWIDTINYVAASLSAAPMAGAVGSQKKFQRPLLPCSITKLNLREQTSDHQERLSQLEAELEQHLTKAPDKAAKSNTVSNYREKEAYLNEEIKRYRAYVYLLRSKLASANGTDGALPPDLPVFRAGDDMPDHHAGDNGRVVPPPIPHRPGGAASPSLPSDRYSYQQAIDQHSLL
ncbi:PH domain-like [Trinorchestia longiramus]|nr:PH domain-like [Trinorchestia longiramus]